METGCYRGEGSAGMETGCYRGEGSAGTETGRYKAYSVFVFASN